MNTSEERLESRCGARAPWWRLGAIMHVLPVVALLASGCSAFRADVGVGVGFGVEVQIPVVLHTGLGYVAPYLYVGHEYEQWWRSGTALSATGPFLHLDSDDANEGHDHMCWGVLPIVTSFSPIGRRDWQRLEVRVYALLFGARLGINPWNLFSPPAPRES